MLIVCTFKKITGDFLPTYDIAGTETITNIASDEAISHIAFYGIGQVYLERTRGKDTYQVDVTSVSGCDPRPGYERPGAKAVFDSHGTLLEIFVSSLDMIVKPGQDNWEHAKWVWKNSLLLKVLTNDAICLLSRLDMPHQLCKIFKNVLQICLL